MGRNKADDKPADKAADKAGDKPKSEDETAPVAAATMMKGDDATAPVDPKLQAKLAARSSDNFDEETVIPPHPIPDEETPLEGAPLRGRTETVPALTVGVRRQPSS